MMTAPAVTTYPVDREHGGLRLAILLAFIGGWIGGGIILSALVTSAGLNLVAVLAGFIVGYVCSVIAERVLKPRWRSGREVQVTPEAVRLVKRGVHESEMRHDQAVQALTWRFEIRRRTRIPKGWSMLALALEANAQYLIVYTFVSPQMLETMPDKDRYHELTPRNAKKKEGAPTDAPSLRLAGEERRLRAAEEVRWTTGAEMLPEDFQAYIAQIQQQFPEWGPIS